MPDQSKKGKGRQANSSPLQPANKLYTPSRRPLGPAANGIGFSAHRQASSPSARSGSSSANGYHLPGRTPSSRDDWRAHMSSSSVGAASADPNATPGPSSGGLPVLTAGFSPFPMATGTFSSSNGMSYAGPSTVGPPTAGPSSTSSPPIPGHQHTGLDGSTGAGAPAGIQHTQTELNPERAQQLVCPWWSTYKRCGKRHCDFSHGEAPGLIELPLICPYWARARGTTNERGCNRGHEDCKFAHYLCEHGQRAPVPKPKPYPRQP